MENKNQMTLRITTSLILASVTFMGGGALASESHNKHQDWTFQGFNGTYSREDLQHGFQIYKEVCAACHGLKHIRFRELKDLGYGEDEVKAIAASYQIPDGPNDTGEMFERPGIPADAFHGPYANDQAARAANNGALPPDQSLIIKARPDGANYVYSLLTGYGQPVPEGVTISEGMHYNPYFPGGQIGMTAPLSEGIVTYSDGTKPSVDKMAHDVVTFLAWTSEPEMESRKSSGLQALMYLSLFSILMYLVMRRTWAKVK